MSKFAHLERDETEHAVKSSSRLGLTWRPSSAPSALASLGLLLLVACRDPTEVKLELSTDARCADVVTTTITTGTLSALEDRPPVTETSRCAAGGRIGSLVITPSQDQNGEFALQVVTGFYKSAQECVTDHYLGGCIVARRALRFIPHTIVDLPIVLEAACIDVPCEVTETCRRGQCVPATLPDPLHCSDPAGCETDAVTDGGAGGAPDNDPSSAGASGAGAVAATGGNSTAGASAGGSDSGGDALGGAAAGGDGTSAAGSTGAPWFIDATEVTRSQYDAWLQTAPDTASQPGECAFNTDFTPSCKWPPGAQGAHPVVCVDWCDASAYCQARGQRLCGNPNGGPATFGNPASVTESQWYSACSSEGAHAYTYGDSYAGTTCNTSDSKLGDTLPVGSLSGCRSPDAEFSAAFDLLGNVNEWEDSCDAHTGAADTCYMRGGAYNAAGNVIDCAFVVTTGRATRLAVLGFRCCH